MGLYADTVDWTHATGARFTVGDVRTIAAGLQTSAALTDAQHAMMIDLQETLTELDKREVEQWPKPSP